MKLLYLEVSSTSKLPMYQSPRSDNVLAKELSHTIKRTLKETSHDCNDAIAGGMKLNSNCVKSKNKMIEGNGS